MLTTSVTWNAASSCEAAPVLYCVLWSTRKRIMRSSGSATDTISESAWARIPSSVTRWWGGPNGHPGEAGFMLPDGLRVCAYSPAQGPDKRAKASAADFQVDAGTFRPPELHIYDSKPARTGCPRLYFQARNVDGR